MQLDLSGGGGGQGGSLTRAYPFLSLLGPGFLLLELADIPPGPPSYFLKDMALSGLPPPTAMTICASQGQTLPHHYINLQALQNQCPLTAANALITETSLAMTYLNHYPPIIGGNFKQIDLRSVSSLVSMQEDTWLPSQPLSRWPEHIIARLSRCGSDSRLGNLHVLHAKLSSLTLGLCSKSFSLTFQNFSESKLSLTFLVLVLNLMHKQFSGDVEEMRLQCI